MPKEAAQKPEATYAGAPLRSSTEFTLHIQKALWAADGWCGPWGGSASAT